MKREGEYPTNEELKYIRDFNCFDEEDVRNLIDYIEEVWWSPDWGFIRTEAESVFSEVGLEEKKDLMLELHTGGWSGNESILRVLKENKWFYMLYWEMSKRGGHEYFRFTKFNSWEVGK